MGSEMCIRDSWTAGIEDNLNEGFNKALFSINQGDPWKKFLLLKNYLSAN